MPFFKKKQVRSGRIDELQAHVKNIRRIAAEDPNGADALQSFLIEDSSWDRAASILEAQNKAAGKLPTPRRELPGPPQAKTVKPANMESSKPPPSEDEAMLQAELHRYLNRIAEDTTPNADGDAEYEEYQR
jgi:hypothetical protein